MKEIIYKNNFVLINAYFYSFWMPYSEFLKYNIDIDIDKKIINKISKISLNN